jgi:hypothetical protein
VQNDCKTNSNLKVFTVYIHSIYCVMNFCFVQKNLTPNRTLQVFIIQSIIIITILLPKIPQQTLLAFRVLVLCMIWCFGSNDYDTIWPNLKFVGYNYENLTENLSSHNSMIKIIFKVSINLKQNYFLICFDYLLQ